MTTGGEERKDRFGWVGHTIADKYEVESIVGEGGFGVVYRAHHKGFAEAVAVKCLKVPGALKPSDRKAFLETFLAEGRLLHQVSRTTADVVQALDVGDATSPSGHWTPYIVLEWLDGIPLSRDLRERGKSGRGGRSLVEAITLLEPAARALAAAHDQGVAHRDIKPSNLFLADLAGRSTLKVVDFGIAKVLTDSATAALATTTSTDDGLGAFTPRYAAPEQFSRRYGATGPWTDVFALALVLVEVVTGKPALEGDDAPQFYIAASDILHRPTLRAKGTPTSDEVEAVLLRAFAVDPKRRYESAGEFWDALVAAVPDLQSRPQSIRPRGNVTTPAPHMAESRSDLEPSGMNSATTERRRRDATWFATRAGVALAVLGSAGACAFLWLGAKEPPRTPGPGTLSVMASAPDAGRPREAPVAELPTPPEGMVYVPPGRFRMGSEREPNEKPEHSVVITRGFFLDRTEVTAKDYAACMRAKACTPNRIHSSDPARDAIVSQACNQGNDPKLERHPVNCIDQEQADRYCHFAKKRLPTEAEWEYAARGTDGRVYPWGNAPPTTCWMAIVTGASGACARRGTWEVGTTADGKSPFGAFDMAGNVWEWVADGYEQYPTSEVQDPLVPSTGPRGVVRGGSWDYSAASARSTSRLALSRTFGQTSTGIRCARSLDEPRTDGGGPPTGAGSGGAAGDPAGTNPPK